jgi:hypothetical protein
MHFIRFFMYPDLIQSPGKTGCHRAIAIVVVALLLSRGELPARDPGKTPAEIGVSAPTFPEWKSACDALPSNRDLKGRMPPSTLLPIRSFSTLEQVVSKFVALNCSGPYAESTFWVGQKPAGTSFLDTNLVWAGRGDRPYQPFAEKLVVPSNSEVFFHGDFHGDVHSIVSCLGWLNRENYLRDFTIARTNFFMVFLGDYTDRGSYGIEVIYTLLQLKIANPNQVFLVRGNHEDLSLVARYGFVAEGRAKYGASFDIRKISRLYELLPAVLYLGTGGDFIQCNHGGMEPGYNPKALLESPSSTAFEFLGVLQQRKFASSQAAMVGQWPAGQRATALASWVDFRPESPTTPSVLGFMWNDFSVVHGEPEFAVDPGRAFVYGENLTRTVLQDASTPEHKVHAVFRAHQHAALLNPMMRRLLASRGLFRHWQSADGLAQANAPVKELEAILERSQSRPLKDGSVWTFNVSPDSYYGEGCGYGFDTFGLLTTADKFEDWRLRVMNLPIVSIP